MNADEFYQKLRPEDVDFTKKIVKAIKENHLPVFATGGAVCRDDKAYSDIDLVVDSNFTHQDFIHRGIEEIASILGAQVRKIGTTHIRELSYSGSAVENRYCIEKDNTVIDLVASPQPFGVIDDLPRVQL